MNTKPFSIILIAMLFAILMLGTTINQAKAEPTGSLPVAVQKKLKKLIQRSKTAAGEMKKLLGSITKGSTPAAFFSRHSELVFAYAQGHAYGVLVVLNESGVDLKKINQTSGGKLAAIVTSHAAIDKIYGQGREVAQVEQILGLKQYQNKDIDRAIYVNSVYQIKMGATTRSDWPVKKKTLSPQELRKYQQWFGPRPSHVHFRPDGVVGVSGSIHSDVPLGGFNYSTGVTWQMQGKDLTLNWYDGVTFTFLYDEMKNQIAANSPNKQWRAILIPSWTFQAQKKLYIISKIAKGETVDSQAKAKPTLYKEVERHKLSSPIQKEQIEGVWIMAQPGVNGDSAVLDFRANGFFLPWYKLSGKAKQANFYIKNNIPEYVFGTMANDWRRPAKFAFALTIPFLHGFLKRRSTFDHKRRHRIRDERAFDEWQLLDNNIIRISRRFYQVSVEKDRLLLQAYAVCTNEIKTATDCWRKKIIVRAKKQELKNWVFKRMDSQQRRDYNTYSSIELLRILPTPKSGPFKLQTKVTTPDYVSLLKSSQHLASEAIPGFMIIDSVINIYRGADSSIEHRFAGQLKLALQLGFGRWLLERKKLGKPICTSYIHSLNPRNKTERETRDILQDYCRDNTTTSGQAKANRATTATPKKTRAKTEALATKPTIVKKPAVNTLAGCWNWSNGSYIVINANGTARNGPVNARWKTVDKAKRHFSISWPPLIDTLTLSAKGDTLSGANNIGFPIFASRQTGAASGLVGRWLWSNGISVNVQPNTTVSGGPFSGTWRKSGKQWLIKWPVLDRVSLSADGLSLKVKNQFGAVTAKRDANCRRAKE